MNNILRPEQRPDYTGKVTTRWVKDNTQNTNHKFAAPPPTMGSAPEKTEKSRSLYEKVIDSIVNLLLGPEEKHTAADSEMRDILRQRLGDLPERTVKNLGDAWEKAQKWADEGLDSTDFGKFSDRVRSQVSTLLETEEKVEATAQNFSQVVSDRIDNYANRMRRAAEARAEARAEFREGGQEEPSAPSYPPMPEYEPSIHYVHDYAQQEQEREFSPLEDFFEEVEQGAPDYYNSDINDLMDNGRTRIHH